MADVCLVCMPYAPLPRPSLSLGLLKAALAREGIAATVVYPNLWFAEEVGVRRYRLCSRFETEVQAGEWTFAGAAFRGAAPDPAPFLRECGPHWLLGGAGEDRDDDGEEDLRATLLALREAAAGFVERAARRVLATGARIVGCTSTFEQHVASLALLRRVRELDPAVVTLLGGANCEAAMGCATHRGFPWVDYVVSGEADELIGGLCRQILEQGPDLPADGLAAGVLGPAHRRRPARLPLAAGGTPPRAVVRDLDALPVPDFDDYFRALGNSTIAPAVRPALLFETSRGCWWGAASHCTFCGLNGASMRYGSKAPERVLDEIRTLEARHGISDLAAVDNILDMGYFETLLPRLAAEDGGRRLFYEVKPNLRRTQIEMLRRAGIAWVQPGIESFSSAALERMGKGVQGWQNVRLLRWAREIGVRLTWQILWGLPAEEDDWYLRMAGWLPLLEHLEPPFALDRIRFDRFSVYHQRPEAFGLTLRPLRALAHIYPLAGADLGELTYYFEAAGRPSPFTAPEAERSADRPGVRALAAAVAAWKAAFRRRPRPVLRVHDVGDEGQALLIRDTRRCAPAPQVRLTGLERAVYLACEDGLPEGKLDAAAAVAAERLEQARLILRLDGRLLALGLRGPLPKLPRQRSLPLGGVRVSRDGAGRARAGASSRGPRETASRAAHRGST
jgi:magnesium-protoporphyrin IX monomethyl ester (oxidative) cyclase